MATAQEQPRVVIASREIAAAPGRIFELIADPAQQPRWDGNDNLAEAPGGQRVRRAREVFTMTLTHDGAIRENQVVEFDEGRVEDGRRLGALGQRVKHCRGRAQIILFCVRSAEQPMMFTAAVRSVVGVGGLAAPDGPSACLGAPLPMCPQRRIKGGIALRRAVKRLITLIHLGI
jgi:hypothetical protein